MKKGIHKSQIVFGRLPVLEAIQARKSIERVFAKDNLHGEFEIELRTHCKSMDIPLKKVPLVKLDKISRNKNHQGVVALLSPIDYQSVEDLIPHLFENGKNPLLVVLDNVQDTGNIGAIARSCEVFGADALILSGKRSASIGEQAIKSSAGALFRIPVCREASTVLLIEKLTNYGLTTLGATLNTDQMIHEHVFSPPLAIIMGSEQNGLPREVCDLCSNLIRIPQAGEIDSLNVSVATGIILYEMIRSSFAQ